MDTPGSFGFGSNGLVSSNGAGGTGHPVMPASHPASKIYLSHLLNPAYHQGISG
jgi:hypothetical protein